MRLGNYLKPQWREICRLHAIGNKNVEIAKKLQVSNALVSSTLARDHCQQYIAALTAHIQYLHGPTIAARQQMLWRIAQQNEDNEPRVAIQAVDVLNKADGTYAAHTKPDIGELNIQIINNFTQEPAREREPAAIEGHAVAVEIEIDDEA
jgi:hypothetical protein